MAKKNYLIYPNPDFTPRVDSMPDGTLVAYDAVSDFWATFDTGLVFRKNSDGSWTRQHRIGCTPIVCKPNRHSQYPLVHVGGQRSPITVHSIVARAWIGGLEPQQDSHSARFPAGWQVDHIDGDIRNAAVINLRILPDWLNYRDGGFIKKLRNKKIDPRMFSPKFLLRYFDRMAEFKNNHTRRQYDKLTRTELLQLLVGPEFSVGDPAERMEYEMTHHMEC